MKAQVHFNTDLGGHFGSAEVQCICKHQMTDGNSSSNTSSPSDWSAA
jgi:hypothetical protein